jgi:hypothetical protein
LRIGGLVGLIVWAKRRYGDELTEVHFSEVDPVTVNDLRSFVDLGRCSFELLGKLKATALQGVPIMPVEDALANPELRECVSAALVIESGLPVKVVARFQ